MGVVEISMIHIDLPLRPPWLRLNGLNQTGFGLDWIPLDFVALDWTDDPFHPLATLRVGKVA